MITQEARLAGSFLLDCRGGQHELLQVSHLGVGEHYPELALDELSHFVPEEGCLLGGGWVAASADALVLLVFGPGRRGRVGRDSLVSPLA